MKRSSVLPLLAVFSSFILGQTPSRKVATILEPESIPRGVVVEEVVKNYAAEKAGLREGDILLAWHRGDASGDIESPFDVANLTIEQALRGGVSLKGARGPEESMWKIEPGSWGLKTRPRLPENLLPPYLEGRTLAKSGKWAEAAEKWRATASQTGDSGPNLVRVWLLSKAADGFAQGREWRNMDEVYEQILQETEETISPAIRGLLLRAWANTYKQRSDWLNAEKYYQESISENQKSRPESLTIASIVDDLGTISAARGDLAEAEERYRQALETRQKLAPGSLEATVSFIRLGDMARQRGNLAKAEEYGRQALEIGQKLAPGGMEVAGSVNILGIVAVLRGDLAKSEEYFLKTLEIRQKLLPGSLTVADILNNLGYVAWHRGELEKAEEYFRQALEIQQKLAPGSVEVAGSFNNIGSVAQERGDLAKAEGYYRQAFEVRQKLAPGSLEVAGSLNNLGNLARKRGELAKVEEYYRQALAIQQKLAPGSLGVGDSLLNLGYLARQRGDLVKAEEYFRQALDLRQKLAPRSLDVADGLNNLGNLAMKRGELAKAEEYHRQALAVRQKLAPGSLAVAESLDNLGNVVMQQGDLTKAEEYCLQALQIRQKLAPGSLEVADSLSSLGDAAKQQGDLVKTEEYYRQALDIRQKLIPQSADYADSLAALAKILRRKEQPAQAAQLYQQAVDVLERQMVNFGGSEETRSKFRSQHLDTYRAYVDLLVAQKQPEPAFYALERSRAQELLETLVAARVDIRRGVDPRLVEKEHLLRELLTGKSNRRIELLKDKSAQAQATALDKEIPEILKQYQEVEGQIRQTSPGYAALTQPQPLSAKEIQQHLLDSDTLLLEYSLGEERSYVFAITQDSIAVFPLAKRADIEAAARELYGFLSDYKVKDETKTGQRARGTAEYAKVLAQLSQMVLGPVAGQLARKRLLVVSDGALQYIPFAVLSTPGDSAAPLVAEHEIVNLPSISTLAVLRREFSGRKPAPKAVAILADPVFDVHDDRLHLASTNETSPAEPSQVTARSELDRSAQGVGVARGIFPRLPFSGREAKAIYSIAQKGNALKELDFEASKATAMNPQLRDYRIVHFATHGLLNNEHPELSGLVFSLVDQQGKSEDGFLRLLDVYNLDLNADLVVLSACQTALGKQIAEEGLVGLTRGFMYAGAPRVMASLWKVDDEATFELMKKFYEGVLKNGQTPAQALRSSQIWMSGQKRWKQPYYWAGFVLQGEWR